MARKAFRSIFTFTIAEEANFPIVEQQQRRGSIYVDGFYDGVLLLANALNKTFQNESESLTGYNIVKNMMGTTFTGYFDF